MPRKLVPGKIEPLDQVDLDPWNIRRPPIREALRRLGAPTPHVMPTVGATYDINHPRKGSMRVRVVEVRSNWIDCVIVSVPHSEKEPGDLVSIGAHLLCELVPVEDADNYALDSASER